MRRTLGEVFRLINIMDVLYYLGDMMYRKSLRYTGITAAVSLLGFLGNLIPGVTTYRVEVAILLPLVVGASALAGGLLLKWIPSVIATRLLSVAEAQDLDLMEDYRKAQQEAHLESLWQRVFRWEWAAGSATRVRPHPVECPPEVCADQNAPPDPDARARDQFLRRARFALAHPQPQSRQRYYLGIDLRYLEDWRNGAFFNRNDNKLAEQFDASATLEAIKREVGYGRLAALADLPTRLACRFWSSMISRIVGMQVGDAVDDLNRHYQTDCFNAQVFLWPGEEDEPWLDRFPAARQELLQRRRRIFQRVFGQSDEDARRMLDRMLLPTFWLATKLRARYDPEYSDGSLGHTAVSDLEAMGVAAERIEPFARLAVDVVGQWRVLQDFLRAAHPELLAPGQAEALRAVRIAAHTNRQGFGCLLKQYAEAGPEASRAADRIGPLVQAAVEARQQYTERLVALRVHHELTRLHYAGYAELLGALRAAAEAAPSIEGGKGR